MLRKERKRNHIKRSMKNTRGRDAQLALSLGHMTLDHRVAISSPRLGVQITQKIK